jgi:hypothetical protein
MNAPGASVDCLKDNRLARRVRYCNPPGPDDGAHLMSKGMDRKKEAKKKPAKTKAEKKAAKKARK